MGMAVTALAVAVIGCAPAAHADQASDYLYQIHTYAFGKRYDNIDWLTERDKVCAAKANGTPIGDLWDMVGKDLPLLTADDANLAGSLASISCGP